MMTQELISFILGAVRNKSIFLQCCATIVLLIAHCPISTHQADQTVSDFSSLSSFGTHLLQKQSTQQAISRVIEVKLYNGHQ